MNNTFSSPQKNSLFLLPPYFKIIGVCLAILGCIPLAYRKFIEAYMYAVNDQGEIATSIGHTQGKLDLFHFVFLLIVIAGLMMTAWAGEKVEDEFYHSFRVRSIIISFILGVLFVICFTLAQVMTGVVYRPFFGIELITGMLLAYLVSFFLQKKFGQ